MRGEANSSTARAKTATETLADPHAFRPGDVRPFIRRHLLPIRRNNISHFELDVSSVVPLINRRVEHDRAAQAGDEWARPGGHVPRDRLDFRPPLPEAKLEVLSLAPDFAQSTASSTPVASKSGRGLPDAVRLELLDLLDDTQGQDARVELPRRSSARARAGLHRGVFCRSPRTGRRRRPTGLERA